MAIAPGAPRYFDVGEAILDRREPAIAQPLEYAAAVGPDRPLLVRFGSLDGVLPRGAIVRSATLRLTSADTEPMKIKSVRRLLVPWKAAGPSVLSARIRKDQSVAPRESASWSARRLGSNWSRAGAQSDGDAAPIEGVTTAPDGTITGLGSTVQAMADRWWENGGFLIQFDAESLLGSSLSPTGRPELTIEYTVPEVQTMIARPDLAVIGWREGQSQVANLGQVDSKPYRVRARVEGVTGEWSAPQPALAVGATATVPIALPKASGGGTRPRVVVEVESDDANPRNDAIETFLGGPEVRATDAKTAYAVARAVRVWNAAAEASRYGFAPDGPAVRLSYVGTGESTLPDADSAAIFPALSALAGIPESASINLDAARMPRVPGAPARGAADRNPGLSGGGDSRGEAAVTLQTDLANEPYEDSAMRRIALEPSGALSLYDVAALNAAGAPPLPRAAVVQLRNASGRPLVDQDVAIWTGDATGFGTAPLATRKTNSEGILVLNASELGPKLFAFALTANGETEVGFLKDPQLRAAAARGNIAPILGVRLNLPTLPIVREGSLAVGKFITDSAETAANVLGLAIDGNAATALRATYRPGGFIEIDLGRDRTVAEVALRADAMPRRFDLRLRGTGEDPAGSLLWTSEGDWNWTRANRPDTVAGGDGVLYRGTAQRGRYLRIVFPEGGEVNLSEILVYAAKVAG